MTHAPFARETRDAYRVGQYPAPGTSPACQCHVPVPCVAGLRRPNRRPFRGCQRCTRVPYPTLCGTFSVIAPARPLSFFLDGQSINPLRGRLWRAAPAPGHGSVPHRAAPQLRGACDRRLWHAMRMQARRATALLTAGAGAGVCLSVPQGGRMRDLRRGHGEGWVNGWGSRS